VIYEGMSVAKAVI